MLGNNDNPLRYSPRAQSSALAQRLVHRCLEPLREDPQKIESVLVNVPWSSWMLAESPSMPLPLVTSALTQVVPRVAWVLYVSLLSY